MVTVALFSLLLLCSCDQQEAPPPPAQPHVLKAPFDVTSIREDLGKPYTKAFKCKATPEPMQDLFFESMYDKESGNSSIVDPKAHDQYKENTKPIKTLESGLATTANRYILSNPPNPEIAQCVMTWLKTWAKKDGLLGQSNHMGDFVRKWALASIALSYIQVRDDENLKQKDREIVEDWIRKLSDRVIQDFSQRTDKASRNNNHLYWAAWGVLTAGIALDDRPMFDWGINGAKLGITQIQADGTLPLEVARGPKAYNYHHYAAIPLFMIANAAASNGIDLFSENNEGLKRLARVILDNMEDQAYFEKITGEKQNLERTITQSNLSWLEPYYQRYHDPAALKWLAGFRPVKHSRVGGDATLLYGHNIVRPDQKDKD